MPQSGGAFIPGDSANVAGWSVQQPYNPLVVSQAIPVQSGVYHLLTTAAGAFTLRAPTLGENGVTLVLVSGSAAAHVVTATGLLQNGVVGGAKNTATFAAFLGASITLVALAGTWSVVSLNVVTVA